MMKFKVLIDTNILIYSEDNKIISGDIQKFHNFSNYYEIFIHEKTFIDLSNDKNIERKNIIKAKVGKYKLLKFKKEPSLEYYSRIHKPRRVNDIIDDNLLFSIEKNLCNYLVTEDRHIYTKALKLGIGDRVFSIKSFNDFISAQYGIPIIDSSFRGILHTEAFNIDPDCKDEIFQSLKKDYEGFEQWYKTKVIGGHRKGFFILDGDKHISGICLYDINNSDYSNGIKLCTFKISEIIGGQKRGELLLRQIILYALELGKNNLYVEVKKDKEFFIEWLQSFGFEIIGNKNTDNNSFVLSKRIISIPKEGKILSNYPQYYLGDSTNIFIVPIQQVYVKKLFPDVLSQSSIPFDVVPTMNTIKKSYVFKKKNNSIKRGDIILFYQTGTNKINKYENNQKLISFGVIEDYLFTQDILEALTFISKRSVYTNNEVEEMMKIGGLSVVNFRYYDDFKKELSYELLIKNGILNGFPQSLQRLMKPMENIKFIKKYLGSYYQ